MIGLKCDTEQIICTHCGTGSWSLSKQTVYLEVGLIPKKDKCSMDLLHLKCLGCGYEIKVQYNSLVKNIPELILKEE